MTTFTRRKRNQLGLKLFIAGFIGIILFAIAIRARAAEEVGSAGASPYQAGQIGLTPFASYRVHEFDSLDGELGIGLAASYALTRNLTLEVWTLSEGYESAPVIDSLTEAGANVKFYAPIKDSGFAPYALLGYSRGIQSGADNMELGAGLEYRFAKHLTAFTDGVWIQNFGLSDPVSYAHAKFRAGLGWRF